MSTEQLLVAKKWILSHPYVMTHAGRKHFIQDETRLVDGKNVVFYTPKGLDSMDVVECLDELNLFGELWYKITGVKQRQFEPDDAFPAMKTQLRWYYSTEAHSLMLRWVTFALAADETDAGSESVYEEDSNTELIPDNSVIHDLEDVQVINVIEEIATRIQQMMI